MLVPMRAILEAADQYRYGQGAFNMNSVGQIEAAIRIHELLHSGAILQGAEASNAFMGGELDFMHGTMEAKRVGAKRIGDAVRKYGENSPVPIALHLDHGKSLESVKACIDGGYTSVMIDGSSLPYEQNVELTREVVKLAHPYGVSVEGELGVLAGVEDHVFSATSTYTNPIQAVDFFKKTGCDALAISYGTCHGANKGKDTKIRREIAIATKECMMHEGIHGFLVSHGSSTVPQEYVQDINALGGQLENAFGIDVAQLVDVAHCGINKINVDTDIRMACTRNLLVMFEEHPELRESGVHRPALQGSQEESEELRPAQLRRLHHGHYHARRCAGCGRGEGRAVHEGRRHRVHRAAAGAVRQLPQEPPHRGRDLRADGRALQEGGHLI
ncbi:MAG: class II fructose-bisphosphate aldolase [Christensenellales bacterium]